MAPVARHHPAAGFIDKEAQCRPFFLAPLGLALAVLDSVLAPSWTPLSGFVVFSGLGSALGLRRRPRLGRRTPGSRIGPGRPPVAFAPVVGGVEAAPLENDPRAGADQPLDLASLALGTGLASADR